jgi:hypothetical protein
MSRYLESVYYLYTCNTFRLPGVQLIGFYGSSCLAGSLDLIHALHPQYPYPQAYHLVDGLITGIPPYGRDCWNETWEEIWEEIYNERAESNDGRSFSRMGAVYSCQSRRDFLLSNEESPRFGEG